MSAAFKIELTDSQYNELQKVVCISLQQWIEIRKQSDWSMVIKQDDTVEVAVAKKVIVIRSYLGLSNRPEDFVTGYVPEPFETISCG